MGISDGWSPVQYFRSKNRIRKPLKKKFWNVNNSGWKSSHITSPAADLFLKTPPGDYAARLIEASGLKGKIKGGAQISPKQANFIVNLGKASSDDILSLINTARETVLRNYSIDLMPEVQILQSTVCG